MHDLLISPHTEHRMKLSYPYQIVTVWRSPHARGEKIGTQLFLPIFRYTHALALNEVAAAGIFCHLVKNCKVMKRSYQNTCIFQGEVIDC